MRITVIPNLRAAGAAALFEPVCARLRDAGAQVVACRNEHGLPSAAGLLAALEGSDLAIAIGGDGTIVHVAKAAAQAGCPVLGINGGHLGFLAGLERDELDRLPALLQGEYTLEERPLLQVNVCKPSGQQTYLAMNEAVVSRGAVSRLLDIHIAAEDTPVLSLRGDGVIIATSTGSTAYSMSAGGPVVNPAVPCMLLTPVCPHCMGTRTHILPLTDRLMVRATAEDGHNGFLTVDGEENVSLDTGDYVSIKRAENTARLVRLNASTFYDVLTKKLSGGR